MAPNVNRNRGQRNNDGVRRRRNRQPQLQPLNSTATRISYASLGIPLVTSADGRTTTTRCFVPGYSPGLANTVGPGIVGAYSSAKFVSPTRVRWEPAVGSDTNGRVYVGFSANPEVYVRYRTLGTDVLRTQFIQGLGDVMSFPVSAETDITVPMSLRRRLFDVNKTADENNVDVMDRSMQIAMFVACDGGPISLTVGSMWYHDTVYVEGIQPLVDV